VSGSTAGLPLTKRLVELHGATLTIDSTLGRGTAVTVLLPAERVVSPPVAA
jgi:signal transduction histidine kinase